MKPNCSSLSASIVALAAILCLNSVAHAQATRTYVSGVGDDANPCSRTAPCKTFPGAISKTAAKGEINVLDPGGYGAVTITKSIVIDGLGTMAGILVSGTPGIIVNAGQNDVVTIRNVTFDGVGTGTYGIRILAAGEVRIENCVIFGFANNAVDFVPTTTNTTLYVQNTHIHNCAGAAVSVKPVGAGGKAVIEHSKLESCGVGIDSTGVATLSDSTVTGSTGAGLLTSGGGSILTYHNNKIYGNNPDGNATGSLPLR